MYRNLQSSPLFLNRFLIPQLRSQHFNQNKITLEGEKNRTRIQKDTSFYFLTNQTESENNRPCKCRGSERRFCGRAGEKEEAGHWVHGCRVDDLEESMIESKPSSESSDSTSTCLCFNNVAQRLKPVTSFLGIQDQIVGFWPFQIELGPIMGFKIQYWASHSSPYLISHF